MRDSRFGAIFGKRIWRLFSMHGVHGVSLAQTAICSRLHTSPTSSASSLLICSIIASASGDNRYPAPADNPIPRIQLLQILRQPLDLQPYQPATGVLPGIAVLPADTNGIRSQHHPQQAERTFTLHLRSEIRATAEGRRSPCASSADESSRPGDNSAIARPSRSPEPPADARPGSRSTTCVAAGAGSGNPGWPRSCGRVSATKNSNSSFNSRLLRLCQSSTWNCTRAFG